MHSRENTDKIKPLFGDSSDRQNPPENNKVFVVCGHDGSAKTQLESLLRRWDLEPIIFDQIASSGKTITEELKEILTRSV